MPPARGVKRAAASALAVAGLLGGCAAAPPGAVNYLCADDSRFALRVEGSGDRAHIVLNGMTFRLHREDSATGVRYACDVLSVSVHGDAARLYIQGSARDCKGIP